MMLTSSAAAPTAATAAITVAVRNNFAVRRRSAACSLEVGLLDSLIVSLNLTIWMAYGTVTTDAGQILLSSVRLDRVHQFAVTLAARILSDSLIISLDTDWLGEMPRCKRKRMPESVVRFCDILAHHVCGGVAIVACGHRMMTGPAPGVIVIVHNMAIGTRRRVVGQVRGAFGIYKSIKANAQPNANQRPQHRCLCHRRSHPGNVNLAITQPHYSIRLAPGNVRAVSTSSLAMPGHAEIRQLPSQAGHPPKPPRRSPGCGAQVGMAFVHPNATLSEQ